jgi:SWIM zinc finger
MQYNSYRYTDRKYRATTQQMEITYFKLQENKIDFRVGVIGWRRIPYILDFCQSTMNITCTCPDYEKRQEKPICKHMLFIISLSNQKDIFNNSIYLEDLKDARKLSTIRQSMMAIIDQKKISAELGESNTVSIERDDYCSICMCDLDEGLIEKCSSCEHVMHIECITSWWDLSSRLNNIKGKCPYCKDPRGFFHMKHKEMDPWKLFDFHAALEDVAQEAVDQQVQEPLLPPPAEEAVVQQVQEQLLPPPAEEAVVQQVQEPLLPPRAQGVFDPTIVELRRVNEILVTIYGLRSINFNDPYIQFLESRLESLRQEYDAIQNAFQAQAQSQ